MKIDWEKVHTYLNGNLNKSEIINFEKELASNKELQQIIDELKVNDILLKQLPKHTTSANFMVDLNAKIDLYERGYFYWFKPLINNFRNLKAMQVAVTASILIVVTFSTYKIGFYNNHTATDIVDPNVDIIAVNDDTMPENKDSLDYNEPTLLIGNDK